MIGGQELLTIGLVAVVVLIALPWAINRVKTSIGLLRSWGGESEP